MTPSPLPPYWRCEAVMILEPVSQTKSPSAQNGFNLLASMPSKGWFWSGSPKVTIPCCIMSALFLFPLMCGSFSREMLIDTHPDLGLVLSSESRHGKVYSPCTLRIPTQKDCSVWTKRYTLPEMPSSGLAIIKARTPVV